jgi:hypothetical protein
MARPDFISMHAAQWPKISQSRMITGIGTPKSHSKIPRPIVSSWSLVAGTIRRRSACSFSLLEKAQTHQWPVLGIEDHGSAGGFGSPFCNSSIECRSGERTNAMLPSRGGRLMVTPIFMSLSQVA